METLLKCGIDVPVGIVPIGLTNDFAKHFNLPGDLDAAAGIVLGGDFAEADVALMNGRGA